MSRSQSLRPNGDSNAASAGRIIGKSAAPSNGVAPVFTREELIELVMACTTRQAQLMEWSTSSQFPLEQRAESAIRARQMDELGTRLMSAYGYPAVALVRARVEFTVTDDGKLEAQREAHDELPDYPDDPRGEWGGFRLNPDKTPKTDPLSGGTGLSSHSEPSPER